MIETTFALIKPDASYELVPNILSIGQNHGLFAADILKARWSQALLAEFYAEHRGRDFFADLLDFMSSGPLVAMTLVGPEAVSKWRFIMGATDPKKAAPRTIRGLWGSKTGPIMHNCVHGSDSIESAKREIELVRNAVVLTSGFVGRFGDEARILERTMRGEPCGVDVWEDKKCQLRPGHRGPHRHKDERS